MKFRSSLAMLGCLLFSATIVHAQNAAKDQGDWPMYGHDPASTRFSPLNQINTTNVSGLTPAWTYHMKKDSPASTNAGPVSGGGKARSSEATPIVVNGTMYLPTPYGTVVALDPVTGSEVWTYTVDKARAAERGVSYWPGDKKSPAAIIVGTTDARLISLNAATGKLSDGFGDHGMVDLKPGVSNGLARNSLNITSPFMIYKDVIITGGGVQESPGPGTAGDIRGWDAHDGKLLWTFHSVPRPGEVGHETWTGDQWKNRSGTNAWGLMTVDAGRGLVYIPFGSPSYDFYGADREGAGLFGNSLVALNATTGKLVWYFQAIHHDLIDYDLESAPILMDVTHDGKKIPSVAFTSKSGYMFILNRLNGKPIYGVKEVPVPPSEIPGEKRPPTEPVPNKPVQLGRNSFNPSEIATVTPEHQAYCENLLNNSDPVPAGATPEEAATHGAMTGGVPFNSFGKKLTILFPGTLGVVNWWGMSYNPKLGYLFVNTNDIADVGKMVKNPRGNDPAYVRTSPWGVYARFWEEKNYWPCQQPPWGQFVAVNVNTGEIAWKVPFGVIPELDAKGVHNTGTLNFGGSIATAGGLVFIAATNDQHFRAFEAATGKILWDTKLETGAYVVPMTYKAKNGKQYLLIVDTGGSYYDRTAGDSVIAFALP